MVSFNCRLKYCTGVNKQPAQKEGVVYYFMSIKIISS